ncbi:hypothetical protein [Ulvibacterium sp.]|uniref:hypothetical protein n=1 Tax=Ulvibacterium sp. TaxID=2665914 RepID=UPI0026241239|nr:hypothetical protein [Ulvibacterium sp.]
MQDEKKDSLLVRIKILEKSFAKVKKLTYVGTIISIIVGGGGLFGILRYMIEYSDHTTKNAIDIHSKETSELRTTFELLERNGKKQEAEKYLIMLEKKQNDYFNIKTINKPINLKPTENTKLDINETDRDKILEKLPNYQVKIFLAKLEENVDESYSEELLNLKKSKTYEMTIDYSLYRIDVIDSLVQNTSKKAYVKVGVGVRIRSRFIVLSEELSSTSIKSLPSLGLLADEKKLAGTIQCDVIGITNPRIFESLPLPSDISSNSVIQSRSFAENVIQLMNDSNTILTPHIISLEGPKDMLKSLEY